jgi:mercuric reductase
MKDTTILKTGIIRSVIAAICCATPILVVALGAIGLSAWLGWVDYVLLPALALFLAMTAYGLWRRQRAAACCTADTQSNKGGPDMADCCNTGGSPKGRYDLAVIGAGSAGFSAAITAAEQGAQVALIGHGMIGGTCVNVGCVPSNTMIRAAEALHGVRAAGRFPGLVGEAHVADWRGLIAAKDDLVSTLRQKKYIDLLPEYNGIAYLEGAARLNGAGVLVNGSHVAADKIIVATGASPAAPDIHGLVDVPWLTSTAALELTEQPRSLLVIGGGYIGCELAQMFARTGTAVTLVTRSRLLPDAEPEVSDALTRYLADEGITVRTGLAYSHIEQRDGDIALTIDVNGRAGTLTAEQVLVTTARTPNTSGLGLSEVGVNQAPNGGILVDDRMRTSAPGIYAAGDLTGRDQFVYMAAYGAKLAARNAR